MFGHAAACALLISLPTMAVAQESAKSKSSESVVEVKKSVSTNGDSKDQHYRKVTRDGRVVEESGDRGLLRGVDVAKDLGKLRRAQDGDARADAKAHSDGKTSTHTRRVVVRDGKTVVDEETVDGKPVRPGSRNRGDLDGLLRDLQRDLDVDMPDMRDLLRDARRGGNVRRDSDSSSHTRRVVVRDGKTIVDEETVDGKPVRPGSRDIGDIDDLLRGMDLDIDVDLRDLLRDARPGGKGGQGSKSSSRTRRIEFRDGKKVLDEETVDGKPARPGRRDSRDLDGLLRDLDIGFDGELDDLLRDLKIPALEGKDTPPRRLRKADDVEVEHAKPVKRKPIRRIVRADGIGRETGAVL